MHNPRAWSVWALAWAIGLCGACSVEDGGGGGEEGAGGEPTPRPPRDGGPRLGDLSFDATGDAEPGPTGGAPVGGTPAGGAPAGGEPPPEGGAGGGTPPVGGAADAGPVVDAGPPEDAAEAVAGPCGVNVAVGDLNAALAADGFLDLDLANPTSVGQAQTCGGAAGGEFAFAYVVPAQTERLAFTTEFPETEHPAVLAVRRRCTPPLETVCGRGAPGAPGTRLAVPDPVPGETLYVFVDTGAREGSTRVRFGVDVTVVPACRNGVDDDLDGRVDVADPGCATVEDTDEVDPEVPAACANGLDDDGDGDTDFPADPDCRAAGGDRESPLCLGGVMPVDLPPEGGVVALPDLVGAGGATASCDPTFGPEHVIRLVLPEPSRIEVTVDEGGVPAALAISLRRTCADPESELACLSSARPGRLTAEIVPAGEVYVLIEDGFAVPAQARQATVRVESAVRDCNDGLDGDFDGRVDLDDPGCENLRDDSEADPPEAPACANGVDDDADGLVDFPDDRGCSAAGDLREGGCSGSPLWQPVGCQIASWVWSSDNRFQDVPSAEANRTLYTGCSHAGDGNDQGLCTLDGLGWVSVDTFVMAGCDASWFHLGGSYTGPCGGHDGDTVRYLVYAEDGCWDYR